MSYKINCACRKFTLVLSFVQLCLMGKSQYNFTELDKMLVVNQKVLGSEGVVLVYKDGKVVYQKEMGEFKIKTRALAGHCSAWITAALVMTFVDEGKISLDDRVSSFLPVFETYGKSYITIRQCLSHQTGIEDNARPLNRIPDRRKFESLEEEVNSYAKREIANNPGTFFFYGNMGLNIAGRVLEVVGKKKFDALAKQRLFTPLNMRNSSFTPEDNAIFPAGGALTTAADYMNFLAMILEKGTFMGKRILSEASIQQMQTIQATGIPKKYVPKVAEGDEYGLGEWIQEMGSNGNASVVLCPGLSGSWALVDNCRKYSCLLFTKTNNGEQRRQPYLEIKKLIDQQFVSACK